MHVLTADDLAALSLFRAWWGDGMGGGRTLPFAGGPADQPAALFDALRQMEAIAAEMRPKRQ